LRQEAENFLVSSSIKSIPGTAVPAGFHTDEQGALQHTGPAAPVTAERRSRDIIAQAKAMNLNPAIVSQLQQGLNQGIALGRVRTEAPTDRPNLHRFVIGMNPKLGGILFGPFSGDEFHERHADYRWISKFVDGQLVADPRLVSFDRAQSPAKEFPYQQVEHYPEDGVYVVDVVEDGKVVERQIWDDTVAVAYITYYRRRVREGDEMRYRYYLGWHVFRNDGESLNRPLDECNLQRGPGTENRYLTSCIPVPANFPDNPFSRMQLQQHGFPWIHVDPVVTRLDHYWDLIDGRDQVVVHIEDEVPRRRIQINVRSPIHSLSDVTIVEHNYSVVATEKVLEEVVTALGKSIASGIDDNLRLRADTLWDELINLQRKLSQKTTLEARASSPVAS